mmetsp:Transcript_9124/g.28531  ORF Transcript_9124/g.28531 Transcript_9124/m.28531 type:complete len:1145 (-) Transcript_9124:413-3847(-)
MGVTFGRLGCEIVVVGVKYVLFFMFLVGRAAARHATASFARVGRQGSIQAFLCCTHLPSTDCVVGTADGHLFVFGGSSKQLEKSIKAHDGFVYAMDAPWLRNGTTSTIAVATGARDGDVKLWNGSLEIISKFDNRGAGPVRSVFVSADASRVLVGSQAAAQVREFRVSDGVPTSAAIAGGGGAAGELWALATHPIEQRATTASDEGALATWDLESSDIRGARRCLILLAGTCRALAYSPDGNLIAACLGGPKSSSKNFCWARQRKDFSDNNTTNKIKSSDEASVPITTARIDGCMQLIRADTGTLVHEFTDVHEWLRDVKFSPDGRILVTGGTDGKVHVYASDEHGQFSRTSSIMLSNGAAIWTLDLSADCRYIQVADEARTLSYGDLRVGVAVADPTSLHAVHWATWTCPFGWATIGAHSSLAAPGGGGYETSNVDKDGKSKIILNLSCLSRSNSTRVIAVGNHHGVLRLLRYPAMDHEAPATIVGIAHVGVMRRLAWTVDDSHLVTVGGLDRNICVWRFKPDLADCTGGTKKYAEDYDDAIDADGGRAMASAVDRAFKTTNFHITASSSIDEDRHDRFSAIIAPWMSTLVPPSNVEEENPALPGVTLRLDCAHGQRSDDIRGCAGYNAHGGIVYPCGALGVVYDPRTHSQCFHYHHSTGDPAHQSSSQETFGCRSGLADVCSLTVSPDGRFAASGDQGPRPHVKVWDSMTGNTISVLPRHLRCGVLLLSFSRNSRHLAATGGDKDHSYSLYATKNGEWNDGFRIAFGVGMRSRGFCSAFIGHAGYPLFVGSSDAVELISPAAAGSIRRQRGFFDEQRSPVVATLCVTRAHVTAVDLLPQKGRTDMKLAVESDSAALAGTATGSLYLWIGTRVVEHVPNAHDGPIYAAAAANKRMVYATSGRDGSIKTWNSRLQSLQCFQLSNALTFLTPTAAALCFGGQHETKVLFIARSGEMCELAITSGRMVLLTEAHARRKKQATETHGLDVNPQHGDIYATSGDDGTVRIWSCLSRRCVMRASPDTLGGATTRCCSWAPDGVQLAVGLGGDPTDKARDGTLLMLRAKIGVSRSAFSCCDYFKFSNQDGPPEVLAEVRKSKAPLVDIKWCSDGTFFLVASEDGRVLNVQRPETHARYLNNCFRYIFTML